MSLGGGSFRLRPGQTDAVRLIRACAIVFGALGVVFLVIAVVAMTRGSQARSSWLSVDATVVSMPSSCEDGDPLLEYTVAGHRHAAGSSSCSSSWHEGQTVHVYVDPSDPTHLMTRLAMVLLPSLFGGLGVVFVVVSVVLTRLAGKVADRLAQAGPAPAGPAGHGALPPRPIWR